MQVLQLPVYVTVSIVLWCVIAKGRAAPTPGVAPASGEEGDWISQEIAADRSGETVREGRFLKEFFVKPAIPVAPAYYYKPYYYSLGAPAYYQPVFRYRQARKKKKRLFVPNFWG